MQAAPYQLAGGGECYADQWQQRQLDGLATQGF
jgi:hypothetical protein